MKMTTEENAVIQYYKQLIRRPDWRREALEGLSNRLVEVIIRNTRGNRLESSTLLVLHTAHTKDEQAD